MNSILSEVCRVIKWLAVRANVDQILSTEVRNNYYVFFLFTFICLFAS